MLNSSTAHKVKQALQQKHSAYSYCALLLPWFHVTKASHQSQPPSCCKVEKKINAAIFSFCLLQSVIEMENQMNGKQIIVLSIFPACPTRVSAEWSWVGDMTRTKCEIEQLGGNKSALTTKSDQHVAAAGSSPFRICPKAVHTKWGIFISLLLRLILLSNIILRFQTGSQGHSFYYCCHC